MRKSYLTEREKEALSQFVFRVRKTLGKNLSSIRLFGSKARGTSHKDSDVDILVSVYHSSSKVKNAVIDIAFDINLEFSVFISPRILPVRIFSARVWRITPFVRTIQSEGILL